MSVKHKIHLTRQINNYYVNLKQPFRAGLDILVV